VTALSYDVHAQPMPPEQPKPDPNETIRAAIRALRAAHETDAIVLAKLLGISRQSLYNRLNGDAPWLAREVAQIADYYNVSVQDLYAGTVDVRPFRRAGARQVFPGRTPPDGTPATPTQHRTVVLHLRSVTAPYLKVGTAA
jgi:DNA-binding XRE family transcriptional regulator